ncbi:MarR family transcriptional regulator [Agromyces endophyticus]|uniref:MarR family winged helix-turn-helix transcriptional regulator n=1 Tax=Agromyces sp. H17E-10 TaxID=2932244 RepID=UPI001FD20F63|nr:helix-turn-helix domain-containing protein [Agromyces sp. H17E-10]UOQ90956.1 MarR family transcriptional regulator [Agromyces sp. H17E-10]
MTSREPAAELARLNSIVSPLRRGLLKAARSAEHLPDLPDAQIEVLRALPRGVVRSPGDLATELGLSRPTVSNLLKAMEAAGLVVRTAAADDRRRVEVSASTRALGLFDRFDRASEAILVDALARLDDADRAALAAALPALERLRDVVQEAARG